MTSLGSLLSYVRSDFARLPSVNACWSRLRSIATPAAESEPARRDEAAACAPAPPPNEPRGEAARILDHIRAALGARLKRELGPADDDLTFGALGLDSISLLELGAGLERRFSVTLADFAAYEHPTPAALAQHLADLLRAEPPPAPQSAPFAATSAREPDLSGMVLPLWSPTKEASI